jgi:hypothetical protein
MDNVEALSATPGELSRCREGHGLRHRTRLSGPGERGVLRRFGKDAPAFTTLVVKGLASPELLMEVDVVAIRGGSR